LRPFGLGRAHRGELQSNSAGGRGPSDFTAHCAVNADSLNTRSTTPEFARLDVAEPRN